MVTCWLGISGTLHEQHLDHLCFGITHLRLCMSICRHMSTSHRRNIARGSSQGSVDLHGAWWQNAWLPAVGRLSGTARAASAAAGAWAPARQQLPPCMQQLQPPAGLRPPPGTCHGRREAGEQLDACLLLNHASDMRRDKRMALFPWPSGICHGRNEAGELFDAHIWLKMSHNLRTVHTWASGTCMAAGKRISCMTHDLINAQPCPNKQCNLQTSIACISGVGSLSCSDSDLAAS